MYETLARAHTGRPVYHIHELDEQLEARLELNRAQGANRGLSSTELRTHQRLRAAAADGTTEFDLFTLVRDPVSRAISSFFQAYRRPPERVSASELSSHEVDEVIERLHHVLPRMIASTDSWFDVQMADVFGIDLFEEPFDHHAGYRVTRRGRIGQVTIRLDRLDSVHRSAARALIGKDVGPLRRANVAEQKSYRDDRRAVLQRFTLTADEADQAMSSRTVRHFFTEQEQADLASAWSMGRVR